MVSEKDIVAREEIKELRARYCWYVSRGDYERIVAMYTPDGIFEFLAGDKRMSVQGHEALREWLKNSTLPGVVFPLIHNEIIMIDGDNAVSTCAMEARTVNPEIPAFSGYYHDRLRRQGGRWLFSERRFFRYYPRMERSGLDIDGSPESGLSAQHKR